MADNVPPRPPPHNSQTQNPSNKLPPGNYDIFVIPPHSAGSGFLHLPSLRPSRNSFLAGFACAATLVIVFQLIWPVVRDVHRALTSGGGLIALLLALVVVIAWYNRTVTWPASSDAREHRQPTDHNSTGRPESTASGDKGPAPSSAGGSWHSARPAPSEANSTWERAREETKRRQEEYKKAQDLRTKLADAEKLRAEQARAREREAADRKSHTTASTKAARDAYHQATASSCDEDGETCSYRPYDQAKSNSRHSQHPSTASSVSGTSETSYAPSASTAKTTPPTSHASFRGPYSTKDPDKIMLGGVHLFTSTSGPHPASQLLSNRGSVTDGLILRITSEGLFIDDDVRQVPQREWDVKAWEIKLVENGKLHGGHEEYYILRITLRGAENKRFVFVLPLMQGAKVDMGLERLRKGSQVRSMGMSGLKESEMRAILNNCGS